MNREITRPIQELAQRLSGPDVVLLLWHPGVEQVELSVRDSTTGAGFHVDVAPEKALDAFYHPFAYAVGGESYHEARAEAATVDG
jgi:hypothetical protein